MNTVQKIMMGVATFTLLAGALPAHAQTVETSNSRGPWSQEWDDSYVRRSYVPAKGIYADGPDTIRIYDNDRVILNRYTEEVYLQSCPSGLAKKHNGCVPPGHTVQRYEIGHRLPDSVTYYVVPQDVVVNLRPIPSGYEYVRVDNNVLFINQGNRNIVDTVTWIAP